MVSIGVWVGVGGLLAAVVGPVALFLSKYFEEFVKHSAQRTEETRYALVRGALSWQGRELDNLIRGAVRAASPEQLH